MREKKTDPELPVLLPFQPGIVSNGEFVPPEPTEAHRRIAHVAMERGRGFALSTAVVALPYYLNTNPVIVKMARYMIGEVLADHG